MTDYPRPTGDSARFGIPFRNHVLAQLPDDCLDHLVAVRLQQRQVLVEQGAVLRHLYFIETGLVSLFGRAGDGTMAHVAVIGAEGAVSLVEVILAARASFTTAIVQVSGEAFRIDIKNAERLFVGPASPAAAKTVLAAYPSVQALIRQMMENSAANARDSLVRRLARLLLTVRVRLSTDAIPMTQEIISTMLDTHRPGVSLAIAALQAEALIRAGHGRITVLDVDGLTRRATSR